MRVANFLLSNLLEVTRQCESLMQQYLYRGRIPAININQGAVEKDLKLSILEYIWPCRIEDITPGCRPGNRGSIPR